MGTSRRDARWRRDRARASRARARGMTRAQQFGGVGAVLLSVWYATLRNAELTPSPRALVVAAPIYAVVAFALYSVVVIARGVIWFPTCEAEAEALARDVARARRELAKRGVRVHDDDDEREDAKPTS